MPRLARVYADGLKQLRDTELELPRLLAIQGPNGQGKSSWHDAIKLGILGHVPPKKALTETRKLSAGEGDIHIRLSFDNGFGIRRSFGSTMKTDVIPTRGESGKDATQARIDDETGSFAPSFDLAAFFALSADKRREVLFRMLPRELLTDWSIELFRRWLGYEQLATEFKVAVDVLWKNHIEGAATPVDGLAGALEYMRESFLKAENDRQTQIDVERAAANEAAAAAAISPPDAELYSALLTELSSIDRRLGDIGQQREAAEKVSKFLQEKEERLGILQRQIDQFDSSLEALLKERDELHMPAPAEAARAAEEMARTAMALSAANDVASMAETSERRKKEVLDATEASLAKLKGLSTCPFCGSTADLKAARSRLRGEAETQREAFATATVFLRSAEADKTSATAAADEAKAKVALYAANAERARRLTQNIRQTEQLRDSTAEAKRNLEARQGAEPTDTKALAEEITTLAVRAIDLRKKIEGHQAASEAAAKAQGAIERASTARRELDRLTARAQIRKEVFNGLKKLRGHVIEQMVGPVEVMANVLLQEIDPAKRFAFVFEREGKSVFDLGFEENGVFRGYDAASTGEDALLGVVFVAALIAAVKPKWRVLLIDNAEMIDDFKHTRRRTHFMEAIARVADRFDNVLISGCCEFAPVEGWTVIDAGSLEVPAIAEVAA